MYPGHRGHRARRWRRWFLVWFFGTGAVMVIGLVIEQAVNPGPASTFGEPPPRTPSASSSPSPAGASASPAGAPALTGPLRLVQGSQQVNGVELGFPHSTAGAVSAADEFLTAVGSTLDPDRAAAVMRMAADPSYTDGPQQAAQGAVSDRKALGLPTGGPVTPGASFQIEPVEYQVRDVTPDRVTVLLLCDGVSTLPGRGTQTRIGVFPVPVHWAQDDWKALPPPSADYENLAAEPDSPQAAADGWQQLEPAGR